MGLKKYDESEQKALEAKENLQKVEDSSHEEKINAIIDENAKLESEEAKLPLGEIQRNLVKKINGLREDYLNKSKQAKKYNYVFTAGLLAVLVACFVLILVNNTTKWGDWVLYVCLGVAIVALIGSFIYSKFSKGKLGEKAQKYVDDLYLSIDDYIYTDEKFSKKDFLPRTQMEDKVFMAAHFYKNIKSTKSRNFCSVEYNGKNLVSADLAGNILLKNRTCPMFLGKIYVYQNNFTEKDKVILFQLKGGQLSKPLDDIENLKLVEGNDTYSIYSNYDKVKTILNQKVINELKGFRIDKTLIDVIVSIREGYTTIGIDYSDDFMNIPVEHEFSFSNVGRTEKDLNRILGIFDLLNK